MKAGDILLFSGSAWYSRWIAHLTQDRNEAPTRCTHVAIATGPDTIIEALFGGVQRTEMKTVHPWMYRPLNIDPATLKQIVKAANSYVGYRYGYSKIALHALDGLLGGAYFFRRFAFVDRWPICSWVVAGAYATQGYTFGVDARAATPDDIADYVQAHPKRYLRIS